MQFKKGSEAAYDDRISVYPREKDGYNSYFDTIKKRKILKSSLIL